MSVIHDGAVGPEDRTAQMTSDKVLEELLRSWTHLSEVYCIGARSQGGGDGDGTDEEVRSHRYFNFKL